MRSFNRLRIAAAAVLVACAGTSESPFLSEISAGGPSLATNKTTYSVAEVSPGGAGISATLTAAADKPYYSRLGDAFNSAIDQNQLFIAEGSDGVVERQSGNNWVKASGGILVEGVREVVLTPGKTYPVHASLSTPIQTGTYRLTVFVSETAGGAKNLAIRSATFEVR
jgi:hypothetical protein